MARPKGQKKIAAIEETFLESRAWSLSTLSAKTGISHPTNFSPNAESSEAE